RTDDRLPLLSNRERQRLKDGTVPWPAPEEEPRRSKRKGGKQDRTARNKAAGAPDRHGFAWNADEDNRLRARFEAGEAIIALAAAHQRKPGAITARLIKLGVITEDGVVL